MKCQLIALFFQIHKLNFNLKAMNCGDPSTNLSIVSKVFTSGSPPSTTFYPTATTIRCITGMRFTDQSSSYLINCTAWGIWTSSPNCYGTKI